MLARQLDSVASRCWPRAAAISRAARRASLRLHRPRPRRFQHFDLHRDGDLVVIGRADLKRKPHAARRPPQGPIDAAAAADVFVVLEDGLQASLADLGRPIWLARRREAVARLADAASTPVAPSVGPVVPSPGYRASRRFLSGSEGGGLAGCPRARMRRMHPSLHGRRRHGNRRRRARGRRAAGVTTRRISSGCCRFGLLACQSPACR